MPSRPFLKPIFSALCVLALGVTGFGQASAQTTNSVLGVALATKGPVPSSITGYAVTTTCTNLQSGIASLAVTTTFSGGGGAGAQNFSLTSNSKCGFKIVATGAGARAALAQISVGANVRATGGFDENQTFTTTDAQAVDTSAATAFNIVIVFPSVTVKKVVFGDELVPGTEYELAVGCVYTGGRSAGGTTFKLKAGASKMITAADIPGLIVGAVCHVAELTTGGAASIAYSTTNADGTTSPGINLPTAAESYNPLTSANLCPTRFADGVCEKGFGFASAGASTDGQTITVTNGFVGDLIVSKVVSGDPKSNIALYEIKVTCTNNANRGPNETFLIKDRQSKVFSGIISGSVCTVTETRSDGATATYSDNSETDDDGKVTIKGTTSGCISSQLTNYPDCRANVIITNNYAASAVTVPTTTAPTTAAPTPAAAAPTTAAPLVAAPIEEPAELDESEETVG